MWKYTLVLYSTDDIVFKIGDNLVLCDSSGSNLLKDCYVSVLDNETHISSFYYETSRISIGLIEGNNLPEDGYTYLYYSNSNYSFQNLTDNIRFKDLSSELDITHTHSWILKETAATCTDTGVAWEQCECGEIQNEVVIPALGHSWEEKLDVGSCTEDSRTWEECSFCGAVQNEIITPTTGHVWIQKEEAATCTDSGKTWEECGCGLIQNDVVIPALGHSFEQKEEFGNCVEDSRTWDECSFCGFVQNEVLTPALGHVYDNDDDNVCNVCYYNRNIERSGDFLDMMPVILTLFLVFPLNIFLIVQVIVLSTILYRRLKKS